MSYEELKMPTKNEINEINAIYKKVNAIKEFMNSNEFPEQQSNIIEIFNYLDKLRSTQGNINNDISLIATLLSKEYIVKTHGGQWSFDAAEKKQGANGLDIDIQYDKQERLVAEIKTTVPYHQHDFGAAQRESIQRDIDKLNNASAQYKYFFVTNLRAYEILQKESYKNRMKNITLVLLTNESSEQNNNIDEPEIDQSNEFKVILGKTYYRKGFININAAASELLAAHGETLTIYLGSLKTKVDQTINRNAEGNSYHNTIRTQQENREIKKWFPNNFLENDVMTYYVLNQNEVFFSFKKL